MRTAIGLMVSVLMVSVLMVGTSTAVAQYHGGDSEDPISGEFAGAMRFHVDTTLFRYVSQTVSSDMEGAESRSSNLLSIGNTGGFGGLFGNLTLGLGYAVTESIVIGAGAQVGYDSLGSSEAPDSDTSFLAIGLAPYFEYLGGDSSTKPFVGATLYVRHMSSTSSEVSFDGVVEEETLSVTFLGGGLTGGAHFFVNDGCSIDLGGKLTYGVLASSDPELPDGLSISVLDFLVTLGVSAWIL